MKYNIASVLNRNSPAFAFLVVLVVISGLAVTFRLVKVADNDMRSELLNESKLIAEALDVNNLLTLNGDSSDLSSPVYKILKNQLNKIKKSEPRYHFVYLLGRNQKGKVFFFVDNVMPGEFGESPPGQIYDEASSELLEVFSKGIANAEGPIEDRWGSFISSMVPVFHPETKEVIAVLGVDINSGMRKQDLFWVAVPPLLVMLTLIGLIFITSGLLWQRDVFGTSAPTWMHFLESELLLAVGLVITFFVAWVSFKRNAHDNKESFNELAASRSESVAKRLTSIKEIELNSLASFFSSNEFVRQNEFDQFSEFLNENPAVKTWNWIRVVKNSEIESFTKDMKMAGIQNFGIWEKNRSGLKIPAKEKDVYYPIVFFTNKSENNAILGFDVGSDSTRLQALLNAAKNYDQFASSYPIQLLQDSTEKNALLLVKSVYKNDSGKNLLGYVVAVLQAGKLLSSSGNDISATPHEFSLILDDGKEYLLSKTDADLTKRNDYILTRYVMVFGEVFKIKVYGQFKKLDFNLYRNAFTSVISGLMLTFSFAFILWFFNRNRFNLEKLVEERTSDLLKSENRFRRVADQLSELILIINHKGIIEYASSASNSLIGMSPESLTGKYFTEFIEKDAVKTCIKAFLDISKNSSGLFNLEFKMKRYDGTFFFSEVSGTPFRHDTGNAVLLTIRDISRRKSAEEEIIRAKEIAEESDKMKTRFLVNISHEIRTPMNGIMGFLELLKDMDLSPEERNMYISFVNKSGQRLMNTINDIIEMSKIETGSMQINNESFSLLEMMEYLFTVFDEKAKEKKIDFSIKLNEELKTLILHNDRIRLQVILNSLISNAIKFTTAGKVEFGCTKEMDLLKFYVLDTGSGIPEARLEHVFVRFFQSEDNLSRSHEGSGLGLSIAKAYAELLGGHIKVESEVNKGSVFSVYLPL